jgi:hypothetical protein
MPLSGYYNKFVSEKDKGNRFFKICGARDGKGTGYRTPEQRRSTRSRDWGTGAYNENHEHDTPFLLTTRMT